MVFAAETDTPMEVVQDKEFPRSMCYAVLSVWLVLELQHWSMRKVDQMLPFRRSKRAYYTKRYLAQFFFSGLFTLFVAISMAAAVMRVAHGEHLINTTYFSFDIYIVGVGIASLQVIMGLQHHFWTKNQYEEAIVLETVPTADRRSCFIEGPNYQRIMQVLEDMDTVEALLDTDEDETEIGDESVYSLAPGSRVRLLEPSRKMQGYLAMAKNLIWENYAVFVSIDEVTYGIDWQGEHTVIDCPLVVLDRIMDPVFYFMAARHLIVHRLSISEVVKKRNGQVELVLLPDVDVKKKLSRVRTQAFRDWYKISEGN